MHGTQGTLGEGRGAERAVTSSWFVKYKIIHWYIMGCLGVRGCLGKCGCALGCGMCLCRWLVGGRLVGSRRVSLSKDIISKKKTTASSLIWPISSFSGFLTRRPMTAVSLCNLLGLGFGCSRLVTY